jgi:hypothetical protein
MKFKFYLVIIIVVFSTGFVGKKGNLDYRIPEGTDIAETALVIPAIQHEEHNSTEHIPASKGINTYHNGPPIAPSYISIPGIGRKSIKSLQGYNSIRLMPGTYKISGLCVFAIRMHSFEEEINVKAGKSYYLVCIGKTPRSTKVKLIER